MIENTLLIEPKTAQESSFTNNTILPDDPFKRRALIPSIIGRLDDTINQKVIQELLCDENELVSEFAALELVKIDDRDMRLSITSSVIQYAPYLSARVLLKALHAEVHEESQLLNGVLEDTTLDWRIRHQAGEVYAATASFEDLAEIHGSQDETLHYYALKGLERFGARSIPLYLETLDSTTERLHLPAAYGLQAALKAVIHQEHRVFWEAARKELPKTHNLLGMTVARYGSLEKAALSFNADDIALRNVLIKHADRRLETVHPKARPILDRLIEDATSDFLYRAASRRREQ